MVASTACNGVRISWVMVPMNALFWALSALRNLARERARAIDCARASDNSSISTVPPSSGAMLVHTVRQASTDRLTPAYT